MTTYYEPEHATRPPVAPHGADYRGAPSDRLEGHEARVLAHQARVEAEIRRMGLHGKSDAVCCLCGCEELLEPAQAARLGWYQRKYDHDDTALRNRDVDWYCPICAGTMEGATDGCQDTRNHV